MMDDEQFQALMGRARHGDEQAVAGLLQSFEDDVRLMVRSRLPRTLRARFDSMDFVQSIWASLFVRPDRELVNFDNAEHFRGYLAGVARNKVLEEFRRRTQTRKYDLSREERLYVRRGDREEPRAVAASDPTPSQQVQAEDRMAQLAAGRSPAEAQALKLRRLGLTFDEIAMQTGLSERTVRRLIGEIRAHLEERQWR